MTSTVPGALVALVKAFRSVNVQGLDVTDGPSLEPDGPYCCVGYGDDNTPGVAMTGSDSNYGGYSDREDYDVACLLSWWVDTDNVTDARQGAYDAYDRILAALEADLTLGGVVTSAMLTATTLTVRHDQAGAAADLRFTVAVSAFK